VGAGYGGPGWVLPAQCRGAATRRGDQPHDRVCPPAHCEFRGGGRRPPELRGLRTRTVDQPGGESPIR
jgi:hypothetical protein